MFTRENTIEAFRKENKENVYWVTTMNEELMVEKFEVLEELPAREGRVKFGDFLFTAYVENATLVRAHVIFANGCETTDYFQLITDYRYNHHFTTGVILAYGYDSYVDPILYDNSNVKHEIGRSMFS